jgi:hypothetical protein
MTDVVKVEIGDAVLYNGDCLEVMSLIGDVDHTISDPPYEASMHTENRAVKTKAGWGTETEAHKFAAMDEVTRDKITEYVVKRTAGWVLYFCQSEGAHYWKEAIERHNGKYRFTGVWVKPTSKPNLSGDSPGLGYESVVGGWCGGGRSKWNGGGAAAVWIANPEKRTIGNNHTSIKPQKVMRDLVAQFSDKGNLILDPFMGSGSTGVAALALGRRFIGIERDPEYFEICCKRIEEAQAGGLTETYVKKKTQVTVALADITKPKNTPPKIERPKPRAEKPVITTERKRFAPPAVKVTKKAEVIKVERIPLIMPVDKFKPILDKYGDNKIDFGLWGDFGDSPRATGMDVESYKNFFCVCFTHFASGKSIAFERSERSDFDPNQVMNILQKFRIITFNGLAYDMVMVALALNGMSPADLHRCSGRIINQGMKPWQSEKEFNVTLPRCDHIDLMEPNPGIKASLKVLQGRLHSKMIMNLPFEPEAWLTPRQMNITTLYCIENDIKDGLKPLFDALKEPLELRRVLSNKYGIDLRSKSDAQVGEAIIKVRAEERLKRKIRRADGIPDHASYKVPPFIRFKTQELKDLAAKIEEAEYSVDTYGKVHGPSWLKKHTLRFGDMDYTMGIGGLHSTEGTRALHSNDERELIDADVAGFYPEVIDKLGMYPEAVGPIFCELFHDNKVTRNDAKVKLKTLTKGTEEYAATEAIVEGGKIQNNGVFGKQGSVYSFLYNPSMMISTTLTGQLSLLMMIEAATLAGIPVPSANTDGLVFYPNRKQKAELNAIIEEWEKSIDFVLERTTYKSLYNANVNNYIAVKEDGKFKLKGDHADPWSENSLRTMMMKSPEMTVLTQAVCDYIKDGIPFEDTINEVSDPRKYITLIRSNDGSTWRKINTGKVIRYYWSVDGDPFLSASGRKVARTDGARPMFELPEYMPDDTDRARYILEANKLARNLGVIGEKEGLL